MTVQQSILLALQVSIVLTVFGFGLQATFGDVLYVLRRPALLGRSIVAIFVIMPIVAVALVKAFEFRQAIEIALVALAISPIPPILPGREQKGGGYAPYALGLMVIMGLLSIVTVPLLLWLLNPSFEHSLSTSPGGIAGVVLKAAVLPLVAGLTVRALLPALAARIAKPVGLVATIVLALGVLAVLISAVPALVPLLGNGTLLAIVLFVVAGLAIGHWLGGPEPSHRLVLALSTATRHPAIALTIAKANYPEVPQLGPAILLYVLVSLVIGVAYQRWRQRGSPQAVATK